MRGIETLREEGREKPKPKRAPKKTLKGEALQLLREDYERIEREVSSLRLRALQHDKREARLLREARSATEEAEVLREVVTILARGVSNEKRVGRAFREAARKLLEDQGIPPPHTLGSSRPRKKKRSTKTKTTETA